MLLKIYALVLATILPAAAAAADAFVFDGFAGRNLSIDGVATITSGGLIELTDVTKEKLGHAFYPYPFTFTNTSTGAPVSFSTTFVFAIVPGSTDYNGHGIAFALSPSTGLPGALPGKLLGLFNTTDNGKPSSDVVAVELDTAQDPEFNDIDANHVGIDVDSLTSKNSTSASSAGLSLISGKPMQVWVDYDGEAMRMDVAIASAGVPKPAAPLVSCELNVSARVADETYVGFSASNGAAASWHYILGWSFSLRGHAQDLDLAKLPSLPSRAKKAPLLLIVSYCLGAVTLLLIAIAVVRFVIKRRTKFAEEEEDWEVEYGPHRISYKDLYIATKGFAEGNVIGAGGFGRVYRGVLPNAATDVAVKKIAHSSKQGMREFVSEIASMSRLRHRNLVQLLGYCRRRGELVLVYDYMANGSLDKHLFDANLPALSWHQRFKIVRGVAAGLLYLHEGWEQVVVHRDIKASNVLLDSDMNGKLGDFGLARLYDRGSTPQTTHVVGTLGYIAPELSKTGKATTSTDVFAFGAFLLEIACGRRPMEFGNDDALGLVDLVLEHWKAGSIAAARDPRIGSKCDEEEVELVLKLGLLCSHPDPKGRPSMNQVVQFLEDHARLPAIVPEELGGSARFCSYGESFDEFVTSFASTSETAAATESSAFFSLSS